MKKIIFLLLLVPVLSKGQGFKVQKRSEAYWDKSLKKQVCCDSIYAVNGWLNAGDNGKADTRYPYLQFTIIKNKREGVYINFDGQLIGEKYTSTSILDSVDIELENNEKIKLVCRENTFFFTPSNGKVTVGSYIFLSEENINLLKTHTISKISFFSSKQVNMKGEVLVQLKYKDEIINCLKALYL